ncbi:MAG: aspartate ammonia-lyase [Chloroflexi bacterium]|nr:aspartate ammonia-lyase [Chloroflexota bacterium]
MTEQPAASTDSPPVTTPASHLTVPSIDTIVLSATEMRREHDLLGEVDVPAAAYWGVHTLRAVQNFPITGVPVAHLPELVRALAMVKKAAALANEKLGYLPHAKAKAIERACDEIIAGRYHEQFVVDVIQGGAGTSTNMNANEVIANVALALMGHRRGEYQHLHPNDDVNMAQSTNDAYPTAVRLAILLALPTLIKALDDFAYALKEKAIEFSDVLKMGRTQLQDAVPMTVGQEFDAFYATVREDIARLREISGFFREVNLGATAIGTGITADPRYAALAVEELARISGHDMVLATNLIEATSDMGAFVLFSGVLKRTAVKLSKICNDLRLLSSGPRAGFNEINLPPVQAGSSIMPGKVNPVIPEVVNQVAFLVIGNDLTVTMASESGQLQLNAFEPTIAFSLLQSIRVLAAGLGTLTARCIRGITVNRERCQHYVETSIGLVTALNPVLGYERSVAIAKEALETGGGVCDLVLEKGWLTKEALDELLRPEAMTQPSRAHE